MVQGTMAWPGLVRLAIPINEWDRDEGALAVGPELQSRDSASRRTCFSHDASLERAADLFSPRRRYSSLSGKILCSDTP